MPLLRPPGAPRSPAAPRRGFGRKQAGGSDFAIVSFASSVKFPQVIKSRKVHWLAMFSALPQRPSPHGAAARSPGRSGDGEGMAPGVRGLDRHGGAL